MIHLYKISRVIKFTQRERRIGGYQGLGNPLQHSCLENPRDQGAWWAAVYGVAQSWTRLKRLSSSSRAWGREGMESCCVICTEV